MSYDLGRELKPVLLGDTSAASGIGHRRGAGRVRHIEIATLWLQRHITSGSMSLRRQPGKDNVADIGTKHIDAATLERHLASMGFVHMDGRSKIALKAAL
eukprot:3539029-Amphidinium_carterae.4